MFGRHHEQEPPATAPEGRDELDVDAGLEDAISEVRQAVSTYLDIPSEGARRDLLASLDQLDSQLARSDDFANTPRFAPGAVGYFTNLPIGATSQNPVVDELPSGVFQTQVALVKAARQEIREHTAGTMTALRAALAALDAAEGGTQGTPPRTPPGTSERPPSPETG